MRAVLRKAGTTALAWRYWQKFRHTGIVFVPTLQGWLSSEYRRHAQDLRPLLEQMASYYGPQSAWRVGIGTLCQRPAELIRKVCAAVADELPGIPFHAWGLTLHTFRGPIVLPRQVIRCDSSS